MYLSRYVTLNDEIDLKNPPHRLTIIMSQSWFN